jgi:hypothetical protein
MKNVNANTYRVLGSEPERILTFYNFLNRLDNKGQTLKEYITEYHGTTPTFIEPIFNRNGFYKNRKTGFTWIEVNGLAYTYKPNDSMFDYNLDVLNQKVHSSREIAAMNELVKLNSLSPKAMKEIRQALYNNRNQYELRMIGLSGLRNRKRFDTLKDKLLTSN